MADLITRDRALLNLGNRTNNAAENRMVDALLSACSRAVERWCHRKFEAQKLDELYDGHGQAKLLLREYPVLAVERVAACPTAVLTVTNTSSSNQRATVQVTDSGLTLIRVASGTTTTDTSVTWASNATLTAVKTAVNALGNGWSATVASGYDNWPSADPRPIQGAINAKDVNANILLHVEELSDYDIDATRGWLTRRDGCDWAEGVRNYRVIYTAGYAEVPEDVQEACAEWAAALFWQAKRDPGLFSQGVTGQGSHTQLLGSARPPHAAHGLLAPYRKHNVGGL